MDKIELNQINTAKVTDKHGSWTIEYNDEGVITYASQPTCHVRSLENLAIGVLASIGAKKLMEE